MQVLIENIIQVLLWRVSAEATAREILCRPTADHHWRNGHGRPKGLASVGTDLGWSTRKVFEEFEKTVTKLEVEW
jgi:hypothetical protein